MSKLKEAIIESLKEVYDPEIPINVYDLGLIYEINVKKNNDVHVVMTLTSPTCPTADYLKEIITEAVKDTKGVKKVTLDLTFDPPWTPDRVSMDAKEELGLPTEPKEDLSVQKVFNDDNSTKENLCFKCQISDEKVPLIKVTYKNEDKLICNNCIKKF